MSTTITLNTKEFSSMLSKASKCSTKGGVAIIAELIEIKLVNGVLSLRTTDTRNTMILRKSGIEGADFAAVINIGVFEKIVSKTTKENIQLTVDDKCVELKGNGSYKFELAIEGDTPVQFEPLMLIQQPEIKEELSLQTMKDVVKYCAAFVGSPFVDPTVSGYYFNARGAITSDSYAACFYNKPLFHQPMMLYASTMELISSWDDEKVVFLKSGNQIQFYSNTGLLSTTVHPHIDDFPADGLSDFLTMDYAAKVGVSIKAAQESLDRVGLFINDKAGNGSIMASFEDSGLALSDKGGNADERLPYVEGSCYSPFLCQISAPDLSKVIDVDKSDNVVISYGNDTAIRVDFTDLVRVLALSEDTIEGQDFGVVEDDTPAITPEAPAASASAVDASMGMPDMDSIQW